MVKTKSDLHKILDNFYLKHFLIEEMISYDNGHELYIFGTAQIVQLRKLEIIFLKHNNFIIVV